MVFAAFVAESRPDVYKRSSYGTSISMPQGRHRLAHLHVLLIQEGGLGGTCILLTQCKRLYAGVAESLGLYAHVMRGRLHELQKQCRYRTDGMAVPEPAKDMSGAPQIRGSQYTHWNCPAFCLVSESLIREERISSMIQLLWSSWLAKICDTRVSTSSRSKRIDLRCGSETRPPASAPW